MISSPLIDAPAGAKWEIHELVLDSGKAPVSEFLDELPGDEVRAFAVRKAKYFEENPPPASSPDTRRR